VTIECVISYLIYSRNRTTNQLAVSQFADWSSDRTTWRQNSLESSQFADNHWNVIFNICSQQIDQYGMENCPVNRFTDHKSPSYYKWSV